MHLTLRTALAAGSALGMASVAHAQFPENFDSLTPPALPAGWSTSVTGAGAPWATSSTPFAGIPAFPSATNGVQTNDVPTSSIQLLDLPLVNTTGATVISLQSSYSTESTWDGWVIKASVNGGAFNIVPASQYRVGAATTTMNATSGSLGSQLAFSGAATAWTTRTAVVPSNPGDTVVFRVHMECDTSAGGVGVALDNVNVTSEATSPCCALDGTCAMVTVSACASSSGTWSLAVDCTAAACPQPGACCKPDGTCVTAQLAACGALGGIFNASPATCGTVTCPASFFGSVEPNETRPQATPVTLSSTTHIMGQTTGTVATPGATSLDQFLVKTPPAALGIYRNRLAITSVPASQLFVGSIRGLTVTAPPLNSTPLLTNASVPTATDSALQTSVTTAPLTRTNQWYGFGKEEQIYYRVVGAASTTGVYTATWTSDPITPSAIGSFQAGPIDITTFGQGHTTDTDLWIYDSNFNAIDKFGNDDRSTVYGGVSSTQSFLRREYAAGTYYLALTNFGQSNNKGAPSDDNFRTGSVLDFPNAAVNTSATTFTSMAFAVTDSLGTTPVAAAKTGQFDINWYSFTVTGSITNGACCSPSGVCSDVGQLTCTQGGGTWSSGSVCSSFTCPTGACCKSAGVCEQTFRAPCVAQGGVFSGDSTPCPPTPACNTQYFLDDGTGEANVGFNTTNVSIAWLNRYTVANNLSVINSVDIAFGTRSAATLNGAPVDIYVWADPNNDGDPSDAGAPLASAAGLVANSGTNIYNNFVLTTPINVGANGTNFFVGAILSATATAGVNPCREDLTLSQGKSWIAGNSGTSPVPPVSPTLTPAHGLAIIDTLAPTLAGNWMIRANAVAGPAACYANCDDSTAAPILNVADFTCFLTRYAANDLYANCDESTTAPVLNVADFTCFLTKYAAGCP